MKWNKLDVKVSMDHGQARITAEDGELVLITKCEECSRERIYRFTSGTADELLARLQIFCTPGVGGAVERNKTEIIHWVCPECHNEVAGQLELRLGDALINDAKKTRFKDNFEDNYLGIVNIKSEIKGAKFPAGPHAYFISPNNALNGLCYWCGSCGNKGWNYQVSKEWMKIIDSVEGAFKDPDTDLQPVNMGQVFYCQQCGAKIKLKATLSVKLPENRAELLTAYERWREVHPH